MALRRAVDNNRVVTLVVDQHVSRRDGMVCDFFGRLASTTTFPVRLAMATGAPLFPALALRDGFSLRHQVWIEPRLVLERPSGDLDTDVRHNTDRMNRVVEGWIRRAPEQWLWMHRRWKVEDHPERWEIPADLRHLLDVRRARRR